VRMARFSRSLPTLFFLLFPVVFISCTTLKKENPAQFETSSLFGMIYDYDNRPCTEVQISIDGREGPTSDINGRFIIQSLARGEHQMRFTKDGFETESLRFNFLNRNQVLYVRMISFGQLLEEAETALALQQWEEANDFIRRAENIKAGDPLARYLYAILLKERGRAREAADVLRGILGAGFTGPYVYLALADIYQYQLHDLEEAAGYLRDYLNIESNREAQKRLEELNTEIEAAAAGG
jgi:tetratricopeptide (TPR) repeat protein